MPAPAAYKVLQMRAWGQWFSGPQQSADVNRVITSADAVWGALATQYDNASSPAAQSLVGALTGDASATTTAGDTNAAAVLSLLGLSPPAASTQSPASTLLAQVLAGQSSGAAAAVSSAVNQSILDTLL
ncbi:MAG TPA: hypothetical protein VME46_21655 [Acidimicrobiales bacterium]|nr:hypothetical protein [Acidimicrobiales bacterium]